MERAPGIRSIRTDLQHATGVTNTYPIVSAAFVDAGWDRPGEVAARIDYWRGSGAPQLRAVVVTRRHAPHWGNAPAIQRACGNPPIVASVAEKDELEARMQAAKVNRPVRDGETLRVGDLTLECAIPSATPMAAWPCSSASAARCSPGIRSRAAALRS